MICVFMMILMGSAGVFCQTRDNIIWASVKAQKKINDKITLILAPIVRINDDITGYQNSSVDYALKYKLNKNWSTQVLGRTWFIPDGQDRQFLWLDIAWSRTLNPFKLSSSLRWHHAFDIKDRMDPDFFRWKTGLTFTGLDRIQFLFNIEPWFQLNKADQWQRIRYEPGLKLKINDPLDLLLMYRRENTINTVPSNNLNMYVLTLTIKV